MTSVISKDASIRPVSRDAYLQMDYFTLIARMDSLGLETVWFKILVKKRKRRRRFSPFSIVDLLGLRSFDFISCD